MEESQVVDYRRILNNIGQHTKINEKIINSVIFENWLKTIEDPSKDLLENMDRFLEEREHNLKCPCCEHNTLIYYDKIYEEDKSKVHSYIERNYCYCEYCGMSVLDADLSRIMRGLNGDKIQKHGVKYTFNEILLILRFLTGDFNKVYGDNNPMLTVYNKELGYSELELRLNSLSKKNMEFIFTDSEGIPSILFVDNKGNYYVENNQIDEKGCQNVTRCHSDGHDFITVLNKESKIIEVKEIYYFTDGTKKIRNAYYSGVIREELTVLQDETVIFKEISYANGDVEHRKYKKDGTSSLTVYDKKYRKKVFMLIDKDGNEYVPSNNVKIDLN